MLDDELEFDRIEKQVEIDATAETVWSLVSQPGWFINDGAVVDHRIEDRGDHLVVTDPVHGSFVLRVVRLEAPRYAAFRWMGREDEQAPSTLTEFWIDDRPEGGVLLRVVESGLASLHDDLELRRATFEGNTKGWDIELGVARAWCSRASVDRSVFLAAAPDDVWPLLTTGDGLARWYAHDGAVVDLRPGGTIEMTWAEHGRFLATVTEVHEPRVLAFRIAAVPDVEPLPADSSQVRLTLRTSGNGCVLTVHADGFDQLRPEHGPVQDAVAQEKRAWTDAFAVLRTLVPAPVAGG